jgi:4-methoxybenzoate monooxygenase (O-demethylating)
MTKVAEKRGSIDARVLDIGPNAIGVLGNPYSFHEKPRGAGPVVRIKSAAGGTGIQDIRKPGEFHVPNRPLENDPPSHTNMRGILPRLLPPAIIRRLAGSSTRCEL